MAASSSADVEEADLPVVFRALDRGDLEEVKALHRILFPVQYSDSFYERLFSEGHFCLVGVVGDRVVAVASARCVGHDGRPSNEAYIMTLGVDERYRRRHLGMRTMDEILALIRERTACEAAVLHVKILNEAAVHFYHRYGFFTDESNDFCRNHYFIDGKHYDARRYELPLQTKLSMLLKSYCRLL